MSLKFFGSALLLSVFWGSNAFASGDTFFDGVRSCLRSQYDTANRSFASEYDYGKMAAQILNERDMIGGPFKGSASITGTTSTSNKTLTWAEYKESFIKSKAEIPYTIALIMSENADDKSNAGCMLSTLKPLQEQPWSPQHEGFTDHLNPGLKSFYLDLPMR